MIAVVGRSGAGKTTLVNLLPRFYDVTGGAILVDGHDMRDVSLASLRSQIGIVTQETVLFDDTIAANIAYGRPSDAAGDRGGGTRRPRARLHQRAAEGYQTQHRRARPAALGRAAAAAGHRPGAAPELADPHPRRGDLVARRRVGAARPGSAANLMLNRTSFVIAHRLSTVRRADAIVVLERGRIVEIGRHDDLLARPSGAYAALYQMQLLEGRRPERRMVYLMINSMTGFASLTREDELATVCVTIRAVNHRLPRSAAASAAEPGRH
ncbi:MAG: ATP-binding cassette domain-containing protein [Vicinamibacterales bacterium]